MAGSLSRDSMLMRPGARLRVLQGDALHIDSHAHTGYVVSSLVSGVLELSVGEATTPLGTDQVGLTNAGQAHAARGRECQIVSLELAPEPLGELVAQLGLAQRNVELRFRSPFVKDEVLAGLAQAISDELLHERAGQDAMVDALVRQLSIHLVRSHLVVRKSDRVEWSRAGPVDRRIRLAVEYLHDHYAEDLTLEEIAGAAFLSEYHFARLFKQLMGSTPHAYLTSLRLEHARSWLAESERPIVEIAALTGFGSQSHLTRVFRAATGTTPHAYRKAARRSLSS